MTRNINNCDGLPAPLALAVKEFDGWSAEHFGKLDIHNSIDAPLYHYTDAAGLEGIIKSQEIWFSSHAHLNDPGEITYGMKIASKILKEIGAESDRKKTLPSLLAFTLRVSVEPETTLGSGVAMVPMVAAFL
jgi:hypothetical protein